MNYRRLFKTGEKHCAACGDPLPAFESNSQPKYACAKQECRRAVYAHFIPKTHEIKPGEVICSLDGCTRPVAPGVFQVRRTRFFCCHSHQVKFYKKCEVGKCLCCGMPIFDFKFMMGKRLYLSKGHRLTYLSRLRVIRFTGPFADSIDAFMEGEGRLYYAKTTWRTARNYLINFFAWLYGQGICCLDDITSELITAYMAHERERGPKTDNYIGHLSTFFAWAKIRNRMAIASPICHRFHRVRQSTKHSRAYSIEQVDQLWATLERVGTNLMKSVVAIGLEAGCRISETAHLRLSEIDFKHKTLFIAKSKNGTERYTHFDEKTEKFLTLWLQERDPHCGHDFVFYTEALTPINNSGHLQSLIKNTVIVSDSNPLGVASFHTHALRHTWATNLANSGLDSITLMALGGWKSWTSMQIYVKTSRERVESQYHEAHVRGQENRVNNPETVVNLCDLFGDLDD